MPVKALTADELLRLWERGDRLAPAHRLVVLLSCARPSVSAAELHAMTVGESEIALLQLRTRTFGGPLVGVESCPGCRTPVEVSIDPEPLIALGDLTHGAQARGQEDAQENVQDDVQEGGALGPQARGDLACGFRSVTVGADGWHLAFRVPTVGDLAALAAEVDPVRARARLFDRCALEVRDPAGEPACAEAIPPTLQQRLGSALDEADPAAALTLPLDCATCHQAWQARLDIASFLWREISVTARRLLREVHELAARYGWSERDILGLSTVRRHAYLEGRWA
jgi:hypothetical protein